jgi:hypothetical protein
LFDTPQPNESDDHKTASKTELVYTSANKNQQQSEIAIIESSDSIMGSKLESASKQPDEEIQATMRSGDLSGAPSAVYLTISEEASEKGSALANFLCQLEMPHTFVS